MYTLSLFFIAIVTIIFSKQINNFIIVCVLVTQTCPTLCNPINSSLPGSSVPGILSR